VLDTPYNEEGLDGRVVPTLATLGTVIIMIICMANPVVKNFTNFNLGLQKI
jgi:hypothetical protein